MDEQVFFVVY